MLIIDNLDGVLADIWMRLVRGGADRKSPFHTPIVATVDASGLPRQRVMVLRKCDESAAILRFHTDLRSDKVSEIGNGAAVSVIGYDATAKIQIRAAGHAVVESDSERAKAAWAASNTSSRRCYLAQPGPGSVSAVATSGLPEDIETRLPELAETEAGRANFAIVMIQLIGLEWLHLAHDGHRRARFTYADSRWHGNWLVP